VTCAYPCKTCGMSLYNTVHDKKKNQFGYHEFVEPDEEPISDEEARAEAQREVNRLARELADRITNYLSSGGLFNPELMEHDKVRELLIDNRALLAALEKLDEN
jgi:hypothetical protein